MPRTLVISDVHANLVALKAVLRHANGNDQYRPDEFWFLGDLMGYGPWPVQVWTTLSSLPVPKGGWLAGNHDWGVLGKLTNLTFIQSDGSSKRQKEYHINQFRDLAWDVIQEHQKILVDKKDIIDHLNSLPVTSSPRRGVYLAHGDFNLDPKVGVSTYMRLPTITPTKLQENFNKIQHKISGNTRQLEIRKNERPRIFCFGHTHIPGMWRWSVSKKQWQTLELLPVLDFEDLAKEPIALNPGSVGFPRSIHRCPSYMLIDWNREKIFFHRVSYDPGLVLKEMRNEPYSKLVHEPGFWRDPDCKK